jgi:hypothetical protein
MRPQGVLSALAGLLLTAIAAGAAPEPAVDYQKQADAAPWTWNDEQASLWHSFQAYQGDYQLEIIRPPNRFGEIKVRFSRDGREVYSWTGHYRTVFAVRGNVLYRTEFHPSASGCSLIAFDLAAGKELWKTNLKGLGPIAHTAYHNLVTLDMPRDDVLRVFGNEAAGRYVEYIDARSGKTIGHKVFPRE